MSEENIEEMSPSKRKMLAKLGKLPADSTAAAETSEPPSSTEDAGYCRVVTFTTEDAGQVRATSKRFTFGVTSG